MTKYTNRWNVTFYTSEGVYLEIKWGIKVFADGRDEAVAKAREQLKPANIEYITYVHAEKLETVEVV